jgi:ketosteroid isomerase-like protein
MADFAADFMPTIERLVQATNARDIEGIVCCFGEDYVLVSPLHPARSFRGKDQVRRNWTQILEAIPDMNARVLRAAADEGSIWTEWEMSGTRRDGGRHLMRGVFVFGIAGGLIRWGRMFLEPVDEGSNDMDLAVRALVQAGRPSEQR